MSLENAKFGDIIAFNGNGFFSKLINVMSGGNVSHVAFVINENKLIESTILDESDRNGVYINSIDDIVDNYDGDVWHLSLKQPIENIEETYAYALDFIGTPYDMGQAAKSALDIMIDNREDFNAFFCSELCCAILEKAGILPADTNSSEVTPIDLCRIKLFNSAKCVKGNGTIKRFNTINIEDFNEY